MRQTVCRHEARREVMALSPGTTLGPYSVTAKIGEGRVEYQ